MTTTPERRPDIDRLRVLATLLVIAFHVAMVFNPAPFYHIRSQDLSFPMLVLCGFISLWHMPLFFVLAGWSLARAAESRNASEILKERLGRIGVPLAMGTVLFMPWIKYLELRSGMDLSHTGLRVTEALVPGFRNVLGMSLPTMPEFHESLGAFLPTFFSRLDRFTWGHLWFLAYLLTFTLVLLPLLARWSRAPRSTFVLRAWMAWLPVAILVMIQVLLRPHWPGIQNLYDDWANVAWYLTFLCAGFALGRDPRLEAFVHRQWKSALAVGVTTCLVLLAGITGVYAAPVVLLVGSAIAAWAFVVAMLGAGRRWLSFDSPALRYLAEAALPIYVLHQAAIVIPGYWLIQLPLGLTLKFLLLLVTAYALTLTTYHFLVRPVTPLRLLFGMRTLACALPRRPAVPVAKTTMIVVLAISITTASRATASPLGRWYAEGGAAQVEIAPCGDALCGRVVWLRSPYDENGCMLSDRRNPDRALQDRPMLGLDILRGLRATGDGAWDGGSIYDPTSGRSYRCMISMAGDDRLLVRGYIGFHVLGRTTTWIRVGTEELRCAAAQPDAEAR